MATEFMRTDVGGEWIDSETGDTTCEGLSEFDKVAMDFQGWLDGDQPVAFDYMGACEYLNRLRWAHEREVRHLKSEIANLRATEASVGTDVVSQLANAVRPTEPPIRATEFGSRFVKTEDEVLRDREVLIASLDANDALRAEAAREADVRNTVI